MIRANKAELYECYIVESDHEDIYIAGKPTHDQIKYVDTVSEMNEITKEKPKKMAKKDFMRLLMAGAAVLA